MVFSMTPIMALTYSFLFGLLHGILPDEHTWPITFSYAIGGASGKEGMKAGLYFSAGFTLQRMLVTELSYLALARFLLLPMVEGIVYIVVGFVMSAAGAIVVRRNRYPHFHFIGHHHKEGLLTEDTGPVISKDCNAHEIIKKHGLNYRLSISHEDDFAVASVVFWKDEE